MAQLHMVFGVFDSVAEAQQAVQLLLGKGFTPETIDLSTPNSLNPTAGDPSVMPAEIDGSGRFLTSLFGSSDVARPDEVERTSILTEAAIHSWNDTIVTVRAESTAEAKQITDLLDAAGAMQ